MKSENGFELVRFSREMDARPGDNEGFEAISNEEKLSQLGRRFFDISTRVNELGHLRTFKHTFESEDGISLTLEMEAHYSYEQREDRTPDNPDGVNRNGAYYIRAIWKEDDEEIREERVYEGFAEENDEGLEGIEVESLFNRVEESVATAEIAYAEREQAIAA